MVDTRDRIGRVDGRCAHWVRGFDAGADGSRAVRYSVIYYVNRPRHGTRGDFRGRREVVACFFWDATTECGH